MSGGAVEGVVFPGEGHVVLEGASMRFRVEWTGVVAGKTDQPCEISDVVWSHRLQGQVSGADRADRTEVSGCGCITDVDDEGAFACLAPPGPCVLAVDMYLGGLRANETVAMEFPSPWTPCRDQLDALRRELDEARRVRALGR